MYFLPISTHSDLKVKEEFKYNPELERMAKKWIEDVLQERLAQGQSLIELLKPGVILCRWVCFIFGLSPSPPF